MERLFGTLRSAQTTNEIKVLLLNERWVLR